MIIYLLEFESDTSFMSLFVLAVSNNNAALVIANISRSFYFIFSLLFSIRKSIGAGEEVSHSLTLKSRRSGSKEVIVSFSANEISGLTGSAEIYVSYS